MAIFIYNSITNAAREGARLAIVNQDPTLVLQRMRAQSAVAESNNGTGRPDRRLPSRRRERQPTSTACSGRWNPLGCLAVVTYASKFDLITPIVRQVLFPSGLVMTATTVLPVEFTCPNPTTASGACPDQP